METLAQTAKFVGEIWKIGIVDSRAIAALIIGVGIMVLIVSSAVGAPALGASFAFSG